MYPQMNNNVDYGTLIDETPMNNNVDYETLTDMTDDNKRLCRDLCKVGICLSCFCSVYLILFLGIIDSELNMDIKNITLF
tara:strand:+ start:607 stop:846 length:240 start_codon:yes stop_codon:yes gene_type:complete